MAAMLNDDAEESVPGLLSSIANGNKTAAETLFPIVYDELHRLASAYLQRERANHTLQPTALIHEAFMRMARPQKAEAGYENIEHFMATAAVVMRRILINHAKAKRTEKRGHGKPYVPIDDVADTFEERSIDLLALDEALLRLADLDPNQARLVELRFFGGMTVEQCAEILQMSPRAVYYDWALARAWLRSQIQDE